METPYPSSERPPEADILRHHAGGIADLPLDMPIAQHGIVLRRRDQQTSTNVPHLVTHHSPTGYEWGYGGSGPADLALNILEWVLRQEGYRGETIACYVGRCFRLAWDLHQAFKRDVIAVCDREDAHIALETVTTWLATVRLATAPLPAATILVVRHGVPLPHPERRCRSSRSAGQRAVRRDGWGVGAPGARRLGHHPGTGHLCPGPVVPEHHTPHPDARGPACPCHPSC